MADARAAATRRAETGRPPAGRVLLESPTETGRLAERIEQLRDAALPMTDAMLEDAVERVVSTMAGDLSARETTLLAEVEALGRTIAAAKSEIAAMRPDDITGSHIPSATDELDAIVAHTAGATTTILEACEALEAMGAELSGAHAQTLQGAVTLIYESCSFQDITGQRITKVVNALKAIDSKVLQIIAAFGPPPSEPLAHERKLENGPQLPAAAMDQSDIDALLASFN